MLAANCIPLSIRGRSVLGARVPIVLTSRADTAETRIASCVIASLIAHANRERQKPA